MHRFIGNFDLSAAEIIITDKKIIHQIKDVLKLKKGEKIILGDGQVDVVEVVIDEISVDKIIVQTKKKLEIRDLKSTVTLYCSILKKENFEWVVQKATEIGVSEIVPIISSRTIKTNLNAVRLNKIAHEAAEQSGRLVLPQILNPVKLKDALMIINPVVDRWFCDGSGSSLSKFEIKEKGIALFIGPEGGWSSEEIDLAKVHNCKIIKLGDTVLRAETAAVVASFVAVNNFYVS